MGYPSASDRPKRRWQAEAADGDDADEVSGGLAPQAPNPHTTAEATRPAAIRWVCSANDSTRDPICAASAAAPYK